MLPESAVDETDLKDLEALLDGEAVASLPHSKMSGGRTRKFDKTELAQL